MTKKSHKSNLDTWDGAIREAKRQITLARLRVEQLEGAIRIMKGQKRNGDPFPSAGEISE